MVARGVILRIGAMLYSAQLLEIRRTEFEVIIEEEPYVKMLPGVLSTAEKRIYEQEMGTIAISESVISDRWKAAREWEGLKLISSDHFVMTAIGASTQ